MENFWEALSMLAAVIVISGFLGCLVIGARMIYHRGIEKRCELEKRGGLFKAVEDYRKNEEAELEELNKRRSELGQE